MLKNVALTVASRTEASSHEDEIVDFQHEIKKKKQFVRVS